MSDNIFENAYFGKAYKTKDNTIVKFILQRGEDDFSVYIPKCKYSVKTTHRYNSKGEFYLGDGEYGHGALDIVSEWEEEIDEEFEKYADFAADNFWHDEMETFDGNPLEEEIYYVCQRCYHAGLKDSYRYIKAKEE